MKSNAELLAPALADGWTLETVAAEIEAHRAQVWRNGDAAAVSEITTNRDFHIWLAGGAMADLLAMHDSALALAKAAGCERMTIIGRRGWDRVMQPYGYRMMLVKDLTR